MARFKFAKKFWLDREVEYPMRRKLIPTDTAETYDVVRAEGQITQRGEPFSAETMNDLENRIDTVIEYAKAERDRDKEEIEESYVARDKFTVIEGFLTNVKGDDDSKVHFVDIPFPGGCNAGNCVVISAMAPSFSQAWALEENGEIDTVSLFNTYSLSIYMNGKLNSLHIRYGVPGVSGTPTISRVKYRIVLMEV